LNRTAGRNIFVIDLEKVLGSSGPAAFAAKSKSAHMSGIWIRVGRGVSPDPNLALKYLPGVRQELANVGVGLWGWHVPFCANPTAATTEAAKVLKWVDDAGLAGIVIDAERTNENPRFQGGAEEAEIYTGALVLGLKQRGCGIAFSSHDQPQLHTDLPFKTFLDHIQDICPQVYYRSSDPAARLAKSVHDYKNLVLPAEFALRYKPTGNITMKDDIPFPDVGTCLEATKTFITLVKQANYQSYSFWCWDTAPEQIWRLFNTTPA